MVNIRLQIKSLFKFSKKPERNLAKINLSFIFIFLNLWDFLINRLIFNGMVFGIVMFSPAVFLWIIGNIRATAAVTLISIFEFIVILVFVIEGFSLSGLSTTSSSIFWLPYLVMSAVNGFWGLNIYSAYREKKLQSKRS